MKYYLPIKNATCSNWDGPRDYYNWSRSHRERQVTYITFMWNQKKMIQMNLFTKQKETHIETNLWLPKGKGKGGIN